MVLNAKIVILGDALVGKTALRNQYMGKGFSGDYLPTLGADFASIDVIIPGSENRTIRFQIWDLAGQPTFAQIRNLYYMHAIGTVLVYDITNRMSLINLKRWMRELVKNVGLPSVFVSILGNKSDLRDRHSISNREAQKYFIDNFLPDFRNEIRDIRLYITSAKLGENVEKAFFSLGKMILDSSH